MMRSARVLLVLALAAASVGASVDVASAKTAAPTIGAKAHVVTAKPHVSSHRGMMPKGVLKKSFTTTAKTSTKTLKYYGGKIIQAPKVIQVLYGAGTYAPYVAPTGVGARHGHPPDGPSFYKHLARSSSLSLHPISSSTNSRGSHQLLELRRPL